MKESLLLTERNLFVRAYLIFLGKISDNFRRNRLFFPQAYLYPRDKIYNCIFAEEKAKKPLPFIVYETVARFSKIYQNSAFVP